MQMPRKGAKEGVNDNTWQDVLAEIATLARLAHPHVVELIEYYVNGHTVFLVTNLLQGKWSRVGRARCGWQQCLSALITPTPQTPIPLSLQVASFWTRCSTAGRTLSWSRGSASARCSRVWRTCTPTASRTAT